MSKCSRCGVSHYGVGEYPDHPVEISPLVLMIPVGIILLLITIALFTGGF